MGFRQADSEKRGGYARVWRIENKGKYSVGQISTSRKKQGADSEWEIDFQDGYVAFVGSAHEKIQNVNVGKKGFPIQITSCDVTNKYDKEKNKTYVNYVIYAFDIYENEGGKTNTDNSTTTKKAVNEPKAKPVEEDSDDELPF